MLLLTQRNASIINYHVTAWLHVSVFGLEAQWQVMLECPVSGFLDGCLNVYFLSETPQ